MQNILEYIIKGNTNLVLITQEGTLDASYPRDSSELCPSLAPISPVGRFRPVTPMITSNSLLSENIYH